METIEAETTTTTFWDYNFTRFGSGDDYSFNNSSEINSTTTEKEAGSWSSSIVVIVAVVIISGAVSALTVFGNLLVLVSFFLERNLRIPSNYFIASLAVTDLLIGMFSIPAFTVTLVLQYWPGGILLCDLWLSLDYTVCLVSQYTVLLITIDRFCSVKIPAKYRVWRTRRRVKLLIMITWICPSLLFGTIHLGWDYIKGYRSLAAWDCQAQFITQAPIFNLALIFTYFWSTLIVLLVLYVGIYHVAWQLAQKAESKQKRMAAMMQLAGTNMTRITVGVAAQRGGGNASVMENEIEVDEVTKSVAALNAASNKKSLGNERYKPRTQVSATKSNQLTLPSHFAPPSIAGPTSTTFGTNSTANTSTTVTGSSTMNTRSVTAGGERFQNEIAAETSSYDDFNEEFDDEDKNNNSTATENGGGSTTGSLANKKTIPANRSFRRWFHWDVSHAFAPRSTVLHSISRWLRLGGAASAVTTLDDESPRPAERSTAGGRDNNRRRGTKTNTDDSSRPDVSTTTLVEESHGHRATTQKPNTDHRSGSTRSRTRVPPPAALLIQNEERESSSTLPLAVEQKLIKSSSTTASYANDITQPVTEYSTSSTATTEVLIQNVMVQQQNPSHRRQQPANTVPTNQQVEDRWMSPPLEEDYSTTIQSSAASKPFDDNQRKTNSQAVAGKIAAIQLDTVIIAKELNDELRSMFAHRASAAAALAGAPLFLNHGSRNTAVLHSRSNNALQAHLNEIWLPHSSSTFKQQNGGTSISNTAASFNGRTPLHPSNDLRFIDSESILSPGSTSSISSVLSYMGSSYRPFVPYHPNNIPSNRMGKPGGMRYYLKHSSAVSSGYDLAVWQARLPSPDKVQQPLSSTDNSMSFCTTPNSIVPSSYSVTTNVKGVGAAEAANVVNGQQAVNPFFQSPSPATSPSDCDVSSTIMSVDESLLVAALPEMSTVENEMDSFFNSSREMYGDGRFTTRSTKAANEMLLVDADIEQESLPKFPSAYIIDRELAAAPSAVPTPPMSLHTSSNVFEQQASRDNLNLLTTSKREDSSQTIILLDQQQDRKNSKSTLPSSAAANAKTSVTSRTNDRDAAMKKPHFDDATANFVFAAQSYESNPPKFQLHPPPRSSGSKKQLSRVSSQYSQHDGNDPDSGEQPNSSSLFYSSVNEEGIMFITDDAVSDYKSLHRKRSERSQRSPMNSFKQRTGKGGSSKQHEILSTRNSMSKKLRVKLQTPSKKSTQKRRARTQDASRGENRARKALRTITVIMGAYLLCWTPWHICTTIIGLNGGDTSSISAHLLNIATWLCYVNSPINPFCYAFANHQFKKTFLRILRGDFRRS